jgi:hypothetical protein
MVSMPITQDQRLFEISTFKDHPFHKDGTFCHPRVSQAIADILADEWDLTNFVNYNHPSTTNGLTEPTTDVRERAEFIYGLSELMDTMMAIGDIEHTNDWDWYVQIECFDGSMHGDYCKDGKLYDYEDPIWGPEGNDVIYCDSFRTSYTTRCDLEDPTQPMKGYKEFYKHFGVKPDPETYYEDLEIILESWDNGTKGVTERLRVGDIKRIIISQR